MYKKLNILEFAEGLGIRLELEPWDSLKALRIKAKCYCWVMGFTAHMTSHERVVEHCEY